jgi:preprotein translocase subunit SecG
METVLIVVHVIIVLALAAVVLMQRSEGGGLGMGAAPSAFLSGRGQASLLTRLTAILGAAFFVTSLALGILATRATAPRSPLDAIAPPPPVSDAPAAPSAPNLLEQLRNRPAGDAPNP